MLHEVALKISNGCCKLHKIDDDNKCEIIAYGIEAILSTTLMVSIVLIISAIVGLFKECVVFLLAFMSLRIYTGGYHASNYLTCFLLLLIDGTIGSIILYFGQDIYRIFVPIAGSVAFATIILLSPLVDNNHLLSERQKKNSRRKSIYILIAIELFTIALLLLKSINLCISLSYGMLSVAVSMISAIYITKRGEVTT